MTRKILRKLNSSTSRHEEVVELLHEKKEEFQMELGDKNDIIEF